MPNKLVYNLVPVFIAIIVQVVQSSQNVDISDISGVSHGVEKQPLQFNSAVKRDDNKHIIRQLTGSPKPNQISVVFLIDVARPMRNNWEIRSEIQLIVEEFDRRDENLVFDYIFLQSR